MMEPGTASPRSTPAPPAFVPELTRDEPSPHEALFWRRAAAWGSTHGPEWWLKYGPPVIGWAAAACVPSARRAVRANLHRLRGRSGPLHDARDVLATFGTYASCLAEVLSNSRPEGPQRPRALVTGERFAREVAEAGQGIVLVTAHTAGWDLVGPLLGDAYDLEMMLVTHPEPDSKAGHLQDEARKRGGVAIAHVGDPLASLPLLHHLRGGGVVALQLDRVVPGMRTRRVTSLLGGEGAVPEGPFRLAQVSGAPILPVFCARRGHREYLVRVCEPRRISRRASEAEIDRVANHVASCMTDFLRAHPTQWFQFGTRA
jgi:phosphatidylinositol dimannoside acyltransferase